MVRETSITNPIIKYLNEKTAGFAWKYHSSGYGITGLPDVFFLFEGKLFGFEVKPVSKKASRIQKHRIAQLRKNGAVAAVVHSVAELKIVLDENGIEHGTS